MNVERLPIIETAMNVEQMLGISQMRHILKYLQLSLKLNKNVFIIKSIHD